VFRGPLRLARDNGRSAGERFDHRRAETLVLGHTQVGRRSAVQLVAIVGAHPARELNRAGRERPAEQVVAEFPQRLQGSRRRRDDAMLPAFLRRSAAARAGTEVVIGALRYARRLGQRLSRNARS